MLISTFIVAILLLFSFHKLNIKYRESGSAHKLLNNFQFFDFEFRFRNRYFKSYKVKNKKNNLYDLINDDLLKLPKGTLGRDFYEWSGRSNKNAVNLYNIYKKKSDTKKITEFKKDWAVTHDLQHFLTGYDTTILGEGLMFTYSLRHELRPTVLAIVLITTIKTLFKRKGYRKFKWWVSLLYEAHKLSKNTKWLMIVDWENRFKQKTKKVKKDLNIRKPELFLMAQAYINKKYQGEA
tara:strand:- start:480 stop:1190 length:711 start_codon:yes stop_codon:yes gene_type:complete